MAKKVLRCMQVLLSIFVGGKVIFPEKLLMEGLQQENIKIQSKMTQ